MVPAKQYASPPLTGRWATFGFVVLTLSILWPRYGYMKIGGSPAFSLFTLAVLLFLVTAAPLQTRSGAIPRALGRAAQAAPLLVASFASWLAWRYFADAFSAVPVRAAVSTARSDIYLTSLFLVGLVVGLRRGGLRGTLIVLTYALLVAEILGLVERIARMNVLLVLGIDFSAGTGAGKWHLITDPKWRGGSFRAQSIFNHPIVFCQYIVCAVPAALMVLQTSTSRRHRTVALAALILALPMIWATGSRAGFPALLIALTIYGIFYLRARMKPGVSASLTTVILILGALLAALAGFGVAQVLASGSNAQETGSTSARVYMFETARIALERSPLWGFGDGSALGIAGINEVGGVGTIDSLPVSITLDFGYFGLALFTVLFITAVTHFISTAIRNSRRGQGMEGLAIAAGLAGLMVIFLVLSIPDNISLVYYFIGLGCGAISLEPMRKARDARRPSPYAPTARDAAADQRFNA